jgi:hypothetical protein
MIDAITAITSSTTSPTYEQISPNELADFENAYEGEEIEFSSIKSIEGTNTVELSDRLFQHIIDIDKEYHDIFSDKMKEVSKAKISSESNALQPENIKLDTPELENIDFLPDSSSMINYQRVVDSMERLQIKAQKVGAWSVKLQIVSSTAAMMAKSLGSMLRG